MKTGSSGARTAIRWLERQFQDGNRWLRPQRKSETRALDMMQYPRKKDREDWQYFKVLECCYHFAGPAHAEQPEEVNEDDGAKVRL